MATRAVSAPYAHIPNALTLARFALIPVFVALVLAVNGRGDGLRDPLDPRSARRISKTVEA